MFTVTFGIKPNLRHRPTDKRQYVTVYYNTGWYYSVCCAYYCVKHSTAPSSYKAFTASFLSSLTPVCTQVDASHLLALLFESQNLINGIYTCLTLSLCHHIPAIRHAWKQVINGSSGFVFTDTWVPARCFISNASSLHTICLLLARQISAFLESSAASL